ncbi:MAG: enoyl-CoA hydratase-related protein, partial [Bacteroidia bacterium]|nr:enoyl-CoA hydratase-related protein [Bacteroidia bacterium]
MFKICMLDYRLEDEIAILSFNQSGSTNVINQETMKAFGEKLLEIKDLQNIKGIIITSSKKDFMAGADLNMIIHLKTAEEVMDLTLQLHQLLRGLETCGKPVVAAINGTALGGGYEICLACHYRIAVNNPKIEIGLPEVMLGLLPGGGGTQRLPRLIGIQAALQFILEGKRVRPQEAKALGLVNQLVDNPEDLIPAAKKWIIEVGKKVQPWDEKGFKIPGGAVMSKEGAMIFTAGAALLRKKTYGNYPATQAIMSAIYEGLQLPFDRALTLEARYFTKCVLSKESKHMIRTLWFTKNSADKGDARPKNIPEKDIKKIGVLGAGMMGAGIAYVSANAGIQVILKDVTKERAELGKKY